MKEQDWPAHWPTRQEVTQFRHRNRKAHESGYRGAVVEREWAEDELRAMGHEMAIPA